MIDPLVARGVGVQLGAESLDALDILRAPVDQGPLIVAEGPSLVIAVEQILAHVGAQPLAEPAEVRADRVEPHQGVVRLSEIPYAQSDQRTDQYEGPEPVGGEQDAETQEKDRDARDRDERDVPHALALP